MAVKRTGQLLAAVALIGAATGAVAQEDRPTLGFGFGSVLGSSSGDPVDTTNASAVLVIGLGKLRIEPELGFVANRIRWGDAERNQTSILVGAGALWELARTPRTSVYAGGRLGLMYASDTIFDGSRFGESGALVLAGEYYPAPLVGLGAEARAGFQAPPSPIGAYHEVIAMTSGVVFVRFYLR